VKDIGLSLEKRKNCETDEYGQHTEKEIMTARGDYEAKLKGLPPLITLLIIKKGYYKNLASECLEQSLETFLLNMA